MISFKYKPLHILIKKKLFYVMLKKIFTNIIKISIITRVHQEGKRVNVTIKCQIRYYTILRKRLDHSKLDLGVPRNWSILPFFH